MSDLPRWREEERVKMLWYKGIKVTLPALEKQSIVNNLTITKISMKVRFEF